MVHLVEEHAPQEHGLVHERLHVDVEEEAAVDQRDGHALRPRVRDRREPREDRRVAGYRSRKPGSRTKASSRGERVLGHLAALARPPPRSLRPDRRDAVLLQRPREPEGPALRQLRAAAGPRHTRATLLRPRRRASPAARGAPTARSRRAPRGAAAADRRATRAPSARRRCRRVVLEQLLGADVDELAWPSRCRRARPGGARGGRPAGRRQRLERPERQLALRREHADLGPLEQRRGAASSSSNRSVSALARPRSTLPAGELGPYSASRRADRTAAASAQVSFDAASRRSTQLGSRYRPACRAGARRPRAPRGGSALSTCDA